MRWLYNLWVAAVTAAAQVLRSAGVRRNQDKLTKGSWTVVRREYSSVRLKSDGRLMCLQLTLPAPPSTTLSRSSSNWQHQTVLAERCGIILPQWCNSPAGEWFIIRPCWVGLGRRGAQNLRGHTSYTSSAHQGGWDQWRPDDLMTAAFRANRKLFSLFYNIEVHPSQGAVSSLHDLGWRTIKRTIKNCPPDLQ